MNSNEERGYESYFRDVPRYGYRGSTVHFTTGGKRSYGSKYMMDTTASPPCKLPKKAIELNLSGIPEPPSEGGPAQSVALDSEGAAQALPSRGLQDNALIDFCIFGKCDAASKPESSSP